MQSSSRALLLLLVALQGGLASRGRRQRDNPYGHQYSHSAPHALRQSMPMAYKPSMSKYPSGDYNSNASTYGHQDNHRRLSVLSKGHQVYSEGKHGHQEYSEGIHGHQGYQQGIHGHQSFSEGKHGHGDFPDLSQFQFQGQKPRTWTARPQPDPDPEGTTRDPAIPDNPEGLKNPSLLTGPWEEEPPKRITEAHFKGVNGSIVEAQAGTTANLPCVILERADHETVSWVRMRDHHIITVGRQTYSKDDRFSVTYNRHLNEWTLHIRYAQNRDAGEYQCQLSTHPPMVFISKLTITQASAIIAGGPERYVHEGSGVVLNCSLRQHTQTPDYVFWYHNRTMINFDTNRKVSVRKTKDGSVLTLASVGRTDSGNYTCLPANARSASITLHIILGDAPAAMQVSGSSLCSLTISLVPALVVLLGLSQAALIWDFIETSLLL